MAALLLIANQTKAELACLVPHTRAHAHSRTAAGYCLGIQMKRLLVAWRSELLTS